MYTLDINNNPNVKKKKDKLMKFWTNSYITPSRTLKPLHDNETATF